MKKLLINFAKDVTFMQNTVVKDIKPEVFKAEVLSESSISCTAMQCATYADCRLADSQIICRVTITITDS